jgi:hypothetical protein
MEDILREWRVYECECITPCLNTDRGFVALSRLLV